MRQRPKRGFGENGFESWGGYMEAKIAKLQEQFVESASKEVIASGSGIFKDIAIFINGYTVPSADELKRIMMIHGGMFHQYMSERTTHIIASNLPNVKIKRLRVMRVVKPDWIVDSVKAGKLLDYRLYLLYSHQSVTQPRLTFDTSNSSTSSVDCLNSTTPTSFLNRGVKSEKTNNSIPTADSQDIAMVPSICSREEASSSDQLTSNTVQDSTVAGCYLSTKEKCMQDKLTFETCSTSPLNDDCHILNEKVDVTSGSDSGVMCSDEYMLSEKLDNVCVPYASITTKESNSGETSTKHETISSTKPSSWNVRSASEAGFITEFYNNSRLHHISTMGATFKQYVNILREKSDHVFVGKNKLFEWVRNRRGESIADVNDMADIRDVGSNKLDKNNKVIMHIDMDCFFVSVGLRNRPDLQGHPVAVTHGKGNPSGSKPRAGVDRKLEFQLYKQRLQEKHNKSPGEDAAPERSMPSRVDDLNETSSMSEIASCSYEARQAGLKNGMFLGQALKLCPNLKTIPYDFEGYKEVSYILYNTVASYTLDIEAVSCDELFVDCTSLLKTTGAHPLDFATVIRQEIKDQTGCPASTGFGSNMLQARLATRKAKPDGQFYLKPEAVAIFIQDIKVKDLPGVGNSLSYKLDGLSVKTCGELQRVSLSKLQKELGFKIGKNLYHNCRGEDDRKLTFDHVRKSVSADVNYGIRFTTQEEAENFYRQLAEEVTRRLKEIAVKGRCITLKVMYRAENAPTETAKFMGHGMCNYVTKSTTLPKAIDDSHTVFREVLSIAGQFRIPPADLRGIGIQITRLETPQRKTVGGLDNFFVKKKTEAKPASDASQSGIQAINELIKSTAEEMPRRALTANVSQSSDTLSAAEEIQALTSVDDGSMQLDPEVLNALPKDIREEVLQEYHRKFGGLAVVGPSHKMEEGTSQQKSSGIKFKEQDMNFSEVETSFLAALPEDLQNEVKAELCKTTSVTPHRSDTETDTQTGWETMLNHDYIYNKIVQEGRKASHTPPTIIHKNYNKTVSESDVPSLSCELTLPEMRALIKEWVSTESVPQPCDIDMLAGHFQQLAATRQIEVLDLLIKCLHRCISTSGCYRTWGQAYENIISKAQDTMKIVYGSRLKVPSTFNNTNAS